MAGFMGGYTPSFGPRRTSSNTQQDDYNRIMQGYRGMLNGSNNPILAEYNFQQSPEEAELIQSLEETSRTGGYSNADQAAIRARSISPIRSAYANAMRTANRATNLSGGYSPNAGAVQAKMAREQSGILADANTNVNASLATMIAEGKSRAASQLAPLVTREGDYRRSIDEGNLAERRKFQTDLPLAALSGMTSLYGTTPARANMFGSHALTARSQDLQRDGQQIQINQGRANTGLNLLQRRYGGR